MKKERRMTDEGKAAGDAVGWRELAHLVSLGGS
jgi:hypothetical protein